MTTTRKALLASGLTLVLLTAASGCAGDDREASAPPGTPTPAAVESPAVAEEQDFCADATTALPLLGLLVFADNMDDPELGSRLSDAADVFAESSPPAEIAQDWSVVYELFETLATAFEGVDPTDGEQLRAAQERLDEGIDEQADAAAAAGERIAAYAAASCDDAAGDVSAISDACALLTAEDVQRVFPADDPVAAGQNFGEGFLECVWSGQNAELSVAVLPAAALAADYTDRMEPLLTSADFGDLADAQAYESMVGIGRVGSSGHTVIFTRGGHGVMVAVRFGEEGSRAADVGAAAELAQTVSARL